MEIIQLNAKSSQNGERPKAPAQNLAQAVITDLKPALRQKDRINVFIDDAFAFSLDLSQVLNFKINKGQKLSQEEVQKLAKASSYGKLYQATLVWVLSKPRSCDETRRYLLNKRCKWQSENKIIAAKQACPATEQSATHYKKRKRDIFSEQDIDKIIESLKEKRFLDDRKYCEYFLDNRDRKKGSSLKKLKLELKKKGIKESLIEECLAKSERDDTSEMRKIIAKRGHKYKEQDQLKAFLLRQGFSYEQINDYFSSENSFSWSLGFCLKGLTKLGWKSSTGASRLIFSESLRIVTL